jgi:peptidoglycan hydrolase-like protein with peptidoglycan-binding domain
MAQAGWGRIDRSSVAGSMARPPRARPAHRAPLARSPRSARLDRCAGACTCGGTCAEAKPVRMVQEALIALKFDLGSFGADAKFGNDTAKAVMGFKKQQKLGFETIGDVGPGTMARLDKLCP